MDELDVDGDACLFYELDLWQWIGLFLWIMKKPRRIDGVGNASDDPIEDCDEA